MPLKQLVKNSAELGSRLATSITRTSYAFAKFSSIGATKTSWQAEKPELQSANR